MKQYRKRPVIIEAMQYHGHWQDDARDIITWADTSAMRWSLAEGLVITTNEGEMIASPGDYIIKGTAGEFYPCKPEIFQEIYDEVNEELESYMRGEWGGR